MVLDITETETSGPRIACHTLGLDEDVACCFANNQSDTTCRDIFSPESNGVIQNGCPHGNCIADCRNLTQLFGSLLQNDMSGRGTGPRIRFNTCANVPGIARAVEGQYLASEFEDIARRLIPMPGDTASFDGLRDATATVTNCLSSTCRNSRGNADCFNEFCSPTRLLVNNTAPNITAVNNCLSKLCNMENYSALPYADADVIGIGVWSSYLLQCLLLALMVFRLVLPAVRQLFSRRVEFSRRVKDEQLGRAAGGKTTLGLLDNFHKTQCWLMSSLMVAAFQYGIFERDMLVLFLLLPLTLNGVLPVALAHLVLVRFHRGTLANTLLTLMSYILSSLVYWILYANTAVGVDINDPENVAYQQFLYKMSALPACGGYSGLAACPDNLRHGSEQVRDASVLVHNVTPAVWAVSSTVLLGVLAAQILDGGVNHTWRRRWGSRQQPAGKSEGAQRQRPHRRLVNWLYWTALVVCLGLIFAQVGLLSIAESLDMMDTKDWGFGQIVAVAVWVPPLIESLYLFIYNRVVSKRDKDEKQEMENLLH